MFPMLIVTDKVFNYEEKQFINLIVPEVGYVKEQVLVENEALLSVGV